ncbi:hypothetical protein CANARDRAFT_133378 [[Candida] arabinofermentans NRRL YB-2248]|uniref:Uncharacterized protein n=1 Tax=[Candida] arabinofermentans NRRL YB-2248 TaxID=983967 RepID=A0A1E4T3J9_9ASCO|nr:hypothetical protein CANARDRAFT_133378 [[Candida] arabinofermentans NRRL YB-2248]
MSTESEALLESIMKTFEKMFDNMIDKISDKLTALEENNKKLKAKFEVVNQELMVKEETIQKAKEFADEKNREMAAFRKGIENSMEDLEARVINVLEENRQKDQADNNTVKARVEALEQRVAVLESTTESGTKVDLDNYAKIKSMEVENQNLMNLVEDLRAQDTHQKANSVLDENHPVLKQMRDDMSKLTETVNQIATDYASFTRRFKKKPERILERIRYLFPRIRLDLDERNDVTLSDYQKQTIETYKRKTALILDLDQPDGLYEQVMAIQEHFTLARLPEIAWTQMLIVNYLRLDHKLYVQGIKTWELLMGRLFMRYNFSKKEDELRRYIINFEVDSAAVAKSQLTAWVNVANEYPGLDSMSVLRCRYEMILGSFGIRDPVYDPIADIKDYDDFRRHIAQHAPFKIEKYKKQDFSTPSSVKLDTDQTPYHHQKSTKPSTA